MKAQQPTNRAAIFELRMRLNASQEKLATDLGISAKTIFRVESDGCTMSPRLAYKLRTLAEKHGHHDLQQIFDERLKEWRVHL